MFQTPGQWWDNADLPPGGGDAPGAPAGGVVDFVAWAEGEDRLLHYVALRRMKNAKAAKRSYDFLGVLALICLQITKERIPSLASVRDTWLHSRLEPISAHLFEKLLADRETAGGAHN